MPGGLALYRRTQKCAIRTEKSDARAMLSRMTDTEPSESPPAHATLAEQINLNIKAEIIRAGYKFIDIEAGIGMSHAAAARRSSGELEWKLSEIERIAAWLGISPDILTTTR